MNSPVTPPRLGTPIFHRPLLVLTALYSTPSLTPLGESWVHRYVRFFREIYGNADADAARIDFCRQLIGSGSLWVDGLHVWSGESNQRKEIPIPNGDSEGDCSGAAPRG
jgi:hypothetical protein